MYADKDQYLTRNFKVAEMACQCCGVCLMRDSFMVKLQALREAYGAPIRVTSGYRCPPHNRQVGGAKESQHVKGNAADLWALDMYKLERLAKEIFKNAMPGPGFVHVDEGPERNWEYK